MTKSVFDNGTFQIERDSEGVPFYMFGEEYSFEIDRLAEFLAALQHHVPDDYRASVALVDKAHHLAEPHGHGVVTVAPTGGK